MPSELLTRLGVTFNDEPQRRVMAGSARWPGGGFGAIMDEVRSVMVHVTVGWPARLKGEEFVTQYIGPPANAAVRPKAGIGTQYFIAGDGTVVGLINTINTARVTWHGNHMNAWAIGVETGCLEYSATPPGNRWVSVATNNDQNADDIPGAKLWLSGHAFFNEAVTSWWTTNTYAGITREAVTGGRRMLFSESQYRSWALLARYLCEQHELPRNFPLLPHALRNQTIDNSATFRRLVLADERFPVLLRSLAAHHIEERHFEAAQAATLQDLYDDAIVEQNNATRTARHNPIWTGLFDIYRGFHGHGFSGSNSRGRKVKADGTVVFFDTDHDCAGPLFDWHRFAREVWDWWWYPFDLSDDLAAPVTTLRPERSAGGSTPIVEYYFEARDFDAKERAYASRALPTGLRSGNGIFDGISSPSTFTFDAAGVPVYAPANGELVAARFPDTDNRVSMAFVLLRHEVFHLPNTLTLEIEGLGSVPLSPGRIDYDQEPAYVYSLVMHLARPEGMSFDAPSTANPDWLNRVLIRKREADLGTDLYDRDPNHGGLPLGAWNSVPPGSVTRPTVLEGWRADVMELHYFMNDLRNGRIALGMSGRNHATPIRVLLGDFLGRGGVIRREAGVVLHGIGFEVFASGFVPPTFQSQMSTNGWALHPSVPLRPPSAIFYQSEWAKTPSAAERQRLDGIGVNPDLVPWWGQAAALTQLHPTLPGPGKLNVQGYAFHVEPLQFMRWLNEVTWASEWPKFQVTDAGGAAVPQSPDHLRPRSRRV